MHCCHLDIVNLIHSINCLSPSKPGEPKINKGNEGVKSNRHIAFLFYSFPMQARLTTTILQFFRATFLF